MAMDLITNAFVHLGLSPRATNSEILLAVITQMKEHPEKMGELARYQSLLLNPETRFLIEFLYYADFDKLDMRVH
jgi:hypothetical protein